MVKDVIAKERPKERLKQSPGSNAHTHGITRTQKDCFAVLAMTHMCMAEKRHCEGATNGATEANRRFNGVNLPGGNAHTHAITRTQKDCFAALTMSTGD
tara:strand:+ start:8348 stop:8644 length:297 start_codon:yes stop_codon:yes gene_type:complete